jgi:hypothetical protein
MSHVIDEDESYTYEILQEKHLEESSRLLGEVFSKSNPMEVFLKTGYEKLYTQALTFSKAVVNEQLSIVAIHKHTKQIHGLVQAGDVAKMKESNFEELEPTKDTEVFEEIERRFREIYGQPKENQFIQIMMVGVRQDCTGKGESDSITVKLYLIYLTGLATKLHQILFAHCAKHGFKHAVVEPANPATYHMYTKKLNGKELSSIDLPTFVSSNGERPFEHFQEKVQLILFDLQ